MDFLEILLAVVAIAWVAVSRDRAVRRQRTRSVLDVVGTLVIAGLVAFVVQLWIIKPYRVPSPSMVRTLRVDDRVIAALKEGRQGLPGRGLGDEGFRLPWEDAPDA